MVRVSFVAFYAQKFHHVVVDNVVLFQDIGGYDLQSTFRVAFAAPEQPTFDSEIGRIKSTFSEITVTSLRHRASLSAMLRVP